MDTFLDITGDPEDGKLVYVDIPGKDQNEEGPSLWADADALYRYKSYGMDVSQEEPCLAKFPIETLDEGVNTDLFEDCVSVYGGY